MNRWVLTVLCSFSILSPLGHATAEPTPTSATAEARLAGDFRFAEASGERTARARAIERSVHELFFALRGIARSKLEEKTRIVPEIALRFENGSIRCSILGAPDAVSPADGRAVDYTVAGETVRLSQRIDRGRLVQSFVSREGSRINTYVPSEDGERYAMQVDLSSPKLPVPVNYTLTYARKR